MKRETILLTGLTLLLIAALVTGNRLWRQTGTTGPDYSQVPATWIGRAACAGCHATADSLWTGSDHDLSMQEITAETITADFDNATFNHLGSQTVFSHHGDQYQVRTEGPDGQPANYQVAYVFGHDPLEQFLIPFPDGRLQALDIAWDSRPADQGGRRWFSLHPDQAVPANDLFHWTALLHNWNFMCAECHSTNLQRRYDPSTNQYRTTWSEIDVSCEACHGPGSRHALWERSAAKGLRPLDPAGTHGLLTNLGSPRPVQWVFEPGQAIATRRGPDISHAEVEACARCHSRRAALTRKYRYDRSFADQFRLSLLDENLYFADGQNQDEVFVYGSFLQSKMYAAGVTCSDCHDPHTAATLGRGNQVCAKCHAAAVYDTPRHHFHQKGKGGDSCLDCHQQARLVMGVDSRRDHGFRVPRPDLSLELNTPNACTDCHQDQTAQWAQDAIVHWYGDQRRQGPHFATAIQAGRMGSPGALEQLRALIIDTRQPAIARATALTLVDRFTDIVELPELGTALQDPDPLVRRAALSSLQFSAPGPPQALAIPLLEDPVLDVRLTAARLVADTPRGPAGRPTVESARADSLWQHYLLENLDRPESYLELATWRESRGEDQEAAAAYQSALALEPRFEAAWLNYADFLRRKANPQQAEAILRQGIANLDQPADLHLALGLLLISQGQRGSALNQLATAAKLNPDDAHLAWVYALALHDDSQNEQALEVLEKALQSHPWDRPCLQALVDISRELKQFQRGLAPAQRLLQLGP